jgi:hypothetical protein
MADILGYIKERQRSLKEYYLFNSIPMRINDVFVKPIDIHLIIDKIEDMFSMDLFGNLKSVEIGHHPVFDLKGVNAAFLNSRFYITNVQDNEDDFLDDFVHELAHLVERDIGEEFYKDGEIFDEFLSKRGALKRILRSHGHDVEKLNFANLLYSPEFDTYINDQVGKEKIKTIIDGLFLSAYSILAVSEYYATGFENYFLGDRRSLKNTCPKLYKKLEQLEEFEDL